jgi:hypothetical protein
VIRARGFSPLAVAIALLGGAVAGLRGVAVYGGAVLGARILSSVLVAVLAEIEERDRELSDLDELAMRLPRGVQVVVTCTLVALLDGAIRTVDGVVAVVIYGGCVLLGWAARRALAPVIRWVVERLCRYEHRLAMDGRGVSEPRIREWNDAWTRAIEHLERERRAQPPAG